MHLVYFDESGNTGNNLHDAEQPVFSLGALIVPEGWWQKVEEELEAALAKHFPDLAIAGTEIHAGDLRRGTGPFKGKLVDERVGLRDAWLGVAKRYNLKLVCRSIDKRKYHLWMTTTFGQGVSINPHVAAFALVAMVVNQHLLSVKALGMFISDENKEIVRDVEKSIRQLRLTAGPLRLSNVIEKGFFIDSAKSRVLQLCDLCVLHVRKKEEVVLGLAPKPFDVQGIALVEQLVWKGNEQIWDVIGWLIEQRKQIDGQKK